MKTGGSPGTPGGNPLRAPGDAPANTCGPTANAVALPNPPFDTTGIST